jgi:fungalysin metallopeptidase (M36)/proprotein convertase P-domain-containing protein/fungalysin/thermolysin propeptide
LCTHRISVGACDSVGCFMRRRERELRRRGIGVAVLAAGALAVAVPGAAAAPRLQRPPGARPKLDVRAGERARVPAATRAARGALGRRLGIEGVVATDPVGGGLRGLLRTDGFLSGPRAGGPATVALDFVRAHATAFGMTAAALDALRLTARSRSSHGVSHLIWVPTSHGVPAYDSQLRVHVAADGRVIAASGPPLGGLRIASATPRLSAAQALAIAQRDVGAPAGFPAARSTSPGAERTTAFSNGDRASLVALDAPSGDRLAWRVTVQGRDPYVYDEAIDADSGELLVRHPLTDFASSAHVFSYHPGAASGGTAQAVDLTPYLNPSATILTGPFAHAYADPNDDGDGTDGPPVEVPPSSGTDWEYPQTLFLPGIGQHCSPFGLAPGICTWDGTTPATEATNRDQVTTQLFFFVSNFHDWLKAAPIGFDDASANFEVGGAGGNDPVKAESDDSILAASPNLNNANMSTPGDGQSPTMQMYLFNADAGFPAVNGGDDASVVYHEYTHGLSNRLVDPVNAFGLDANQSGAMGEAWSDWYAMDYLVAHGFVFDTAGDGEVVVGEYVTGDTEHGIRSQPLDCAVGSGAAACGGSVTAGHDGGFTYADLGHVTGYNASTPAFEVHADGEIWGELLWDLRKALGATTARMLITDALRLSPLFPSFLDQRNALLAADQLDDAGAHHDEIWQLFAARGMGFAARTTSSNATRAVASFATPALAAPHATDIDDGAPLGDGDAVAEPGEAVRLSVALEDPGLQDLTNVHATLTSDDPGAVVGQADADYGTIAAGSSGASATAFTVTLTTALACGAHVPFTLHVASDEGTVDLPVEVALGSGSTTFSSSAPPGLSIPDGNPTSGRTSTLTVPSSGRVDHLRATLTVSHTFVGDLTVQLTSPSGKSIDLLERPGFGEFGSDDHWAGPVTFADDAGSSIQEIGDGGTLSGPYVPDEPLSSFAGEDRAGTWTLRITDAATPDAGTLNGWSIDTDQPACDVAAPVTPPPPPPPPPPGGGGSTTGSGTATPPSSATGGIATPPAARVSRATRRARLDRRNRFAYVFHATPAGLRGTIRFVLPKRRHARALLLGRARFTTTPSGRVRVVIRLRGTALRRLRTLRSATVTVTIALGGRRFVLPLRLSAPRPPGGRLAAAPPGAHRG